MAEPKPKGSLLKKKIGGVPAPMVLVLVGVAGYYLYKKYKGSSAASSTPATTPSDPAYQYGDQGGGGSGGGGGSPTTATTPPVTNFNYPGDQTTNTNTTAPIFDTAQPGNPYGEGVAYVEPGVGDLPPGVLPVVYNPPNTTTLSPASGALASNPAQGGHSL